MKITKEQLKNRKRNFKEESEYQTFFKKGSKLVNLFHKFWDEKK